MTLEINEIDQIVGLYKPVQPKSMILTVMGDIVSVHGGNIWGGDLVKINQLFRITKYSSRISLQRLYQENWLIKKKIKNKKYCYYSLSQAGIRTFQNSYQLIYFPNKSNEWNNKWQIVIIQEKENELISRFIMELKWMGFEKLTKNVFISPQNDPNQLNRVILNRKMTGKVLIFSGGVDDLGQIKTLKKFVCNLWPMENMIEKYNHFYHCFKKISTSKIMTQIEKSEEKSFYLRLKLVHEYRRLILRSPQLPYALEKKHLPYKKIYSLCCQLYQALTKASHSYIIGQLHSSQGKFPQVEHHFYDRFNLEKQNFTDNSGTTRSSEKLRIYA